MKSTSALFLALGLLLIHFLVAEPHRIRHERHRNASKHLLKHPEQNEVLPYPDIEVKDGVPVLREDEPPAQTRPPSYLTELYNSLAGLAGESNDSTIVRAIFPDALTHEHSSGVSILTYNLASKKTANFRRAQVIFTLQESELELPVGSHMSVIGYFRQQQEKQAQEIGRGRQFYKFDFTELLKASREGSPVEGPFRLEVSVFKNYRRKEIPFEHVFNLQNEKPFILLQFNYHVPEAEDLGTDDIDEEYKTSPDPRRRRRSLQVEEFSIQEPTPTVSGIRRPTVRSPVIRRREAGGRRAKVVNQTTTTTTEPPTRGRPYPLATVSPEMCRRHEWLVSPADVGLELFLPVALDLGFCAGACPYPLGNAAYNYTLHSYLRDQYRVLREVDAPELLPCANCIPVTYNRLKVMERDGNGYAMNYYKDASVGSCGCR